MTHVVRAWALLALSGGVTAAVGDTVEWNGRSISYDGAASCATAANGDLVLRFTNVSPGANGTFSLPPGDPIPARILAVGGGGAGGTVVTEGLIGAGGGGAGGFVDRRGLSLAAGTYAVTVGLGGAAPATAEASVAGAAGGDSFVAVAGADIVRAHGGGGGAVGTGTGGNGGCGGGAAGDASSAPGTGLEGEGFAGGASKYAPYGAGGGGAGALGGESGSATGHGGDGRVSDITDTAVVYAGGGGGGKAGQGILAAQGGAGGGGKGGTRSESIATSGADGLGGGGGGSGGNGVGGAGGSGVVIVRLQVPLTLPSVQEGLVFTGSNQCALVTATVSEKHVFSFDADPASCTNATNAGAYYFYVEASDGSFAKTRVDWAIGTALVAKPTSAGTLPFTGTEQRGVVDSAQAACYEWLGDYAATERGDYEAVATLKNIEGAAVKNCTWADGSDSPLTVAWAIGIRAVAPPTLADPHEFAYDGFPHVGVLTSADASYYTLKGVCSSRDAGEFVVIAKLVDPAGTLWADTGDTADKTFGWRIVPTPIVPPSVVPGLAYNRTEQNGIIDSKDAASYEMTGGDRFATDAGDHVVTFTLKDPVNSAWTTGGSAPLELTWTMAKAANAVTALSQAGWRLGDTPPTPVAHSDYGEDTIVFSWARHKAAEEEEWIYDPSAIIETGNWYVRAVVPEGANWEGAERIELVQTWEEPYQAYRNEVEITVKNTGGADMGVPFSALVRVSEDLYGFLYSEAGVDGKELAFTLEDGTILNYEVDTWNRSGESLLWVQLPTLPKGGAKMKMYWNLKAGHKAPVAYEPTKAWAENYVGVWHLNEKATDRTAADTKAKDSTIHLLDAKAESRGGSSEDVKQMIDDEGVIGRGRRISNEEDQSNSLTIPNYDFCEVGGVFTFSAWVRIDTRDRANSYPQLARRRLDTSSTGTNDKGWHIELPQESSKPVNTKLYVRGSGVADSKTFKPNTIPNYNGTGYHYYTVVFNGASVSVYVNGVQMKNGNTTAGTITPAEDCGIPLYLGYSNFNGVFDEVRLFKGTVSAARIQTTYANMTDPSTVSFTSLVKKDGLYLNHWLVKPSVTPNAWVSGETPGVVDYGALAESVAKVLYVNVDNPSVTNDVQPTTEVGTYRAVFSIADPTGYAPLPEPRELLFAILPDNGSLDIVGTLGDSGRVLVMSRDQTAGVGAENGEIANQGYNDTNTNAPTFWQFRNLDPVEGGMDVLQNQQPGTDSVLWTKGYGRDLWHLVNCRHGNTYPKSDATPLSPNQAYLPYSPRSFGFAGRRLATRATAAQIVMRNTPDAAVYSGVFTNGVGTLYFDAANAWVRGESGQTITNRLVVAYALSADSAMRAESVPREDGGYDIIEDFWDYEQFEWTNAEMRVFRRDGGAFASFGATNELDLVIDNGGKADSFYRIAVPLNIRVPVRLAIRRVGTAGDADATGPDDTGIILLDNIIASEPASRVDIRPTGWFDEKKVGRETLGQEYGFDIPFPAAGETVYGRGVAYDVNRPGVDVVDEFSSARMHYRWRYLDQRATEWTDVALERDPSGSGLRTVTPLELPEGAGDVEFWYDSFLDAPSYKYVDYTGLDLAIGYAERVLAATNRMDAASLLPSRGTDWFVRLRDGRSNTESVRLLVRRGKAGAEEPYSMTLVRDGIWRVLVPTPDPIPTPTGETGGLYYRFETLNVQTPGEEFAFSTNRWQGGRNSIALPDSTTVAADVGETATWCTVPCDATTGYLMFQYDEKSQSLTVAHADYQNFNGWHDANSKDGNFVGFSTADGGKSGVSRKMTRMEESFSDWTDTPAESAYWIETFVDNAGKAYDEFDLAVTPNGWTAGPGQWAYGHYRYTSASKVLQMQGQGKGYIQLVGSPVTPRGVETVSFRARLAQNVELDDLAYDGKQTGKTDYTFVSRVAFDTEGTKSFSGAASLSLFAYYTPQVGGYEVRLEQLSASKDKNNVVTGISTNSQRLCLYRWKRAGAGKIITPKLLYAVTNNTSNAKMATPTSPSDTSQKYLPFFICVRDLGGSGLTNRISCGIRHPIAANATDAEYSKYVKASASWLSFYYNDTAADRPRSGTYGVLAANSEGVFLQPTTYSGFVDLVKGDGTSTVEKSYPATRFSQGKATFSGTAHSCQGDFERDWIGVGEGMRTASFEYDRQYCWGLKGTLPAPVRLGFYTAPQGTLNWGTNWLAGCADACVRSFGPRGKVGELFTFPVYSAEPCSVKIKVEGASDDIRTDVVIDDIKIRQWGGDTYGSDDTASFVAPGGASSGYPTNVVFTSGWIEDKTVHLNARRTVIGTPCSIRGPLYDGNSGRGIGLGMVAFDYRHATPNVNLLVQIATNVSGTVWSETTKLEDSWVTVTNFSFAGATDLVSGSRSCYIGLHGVKGVARILMDPEVVKASAKLTDPKDFPDIEITRFICRDEPTLDISDWWAWNARNYSFPQDTTNVGDDDGRRSLLEDWNGADSGLSMALNHSTDEGVASDERATASEHMPFVATPTFVSNIVGEVMFKARKYDDSDTSQYAEIALYGAQASDVTPDSAWTEVARFVVSNAYYTTYTFRSPSDSYRAFRFGVTGVKGVTDPDSRGSVPKCGVLPVRVMIDEIIVSESVFPKLGFRYLYPFRSQLDEAAANTNVVDAMGRPIREEQPLLGENWTVQAELEATLLPDEIDLTTPGHEPRVIFHWIKGQMPWGYAKWGTTRAAKTAELARAPGGGLVYRGSFPVAPEAIVESTEPNEDGVKGVGYAVVQYAADVIYWNVEGGVKTNSISNTEWIQPPWFAPKDLNNVGGKPRDFSPYTILESVSPDRVWINEVNVWDGRSGGKDPGKENQYIEIAVPAGQSIEGWRLDYVSGDAVTNTLCTFGKNEVAASKKLNETDEYVFLAVHSDKSSKSGLWSAEKGEIDGVWTSRIGAVTDGTLEDTKSIAVRLVRPSGIVEQEIAFEGTNVWATGRYTTRTLDTYVQKLLSSPGAQYYAVGNEWDNEPIAGLNGRSLGVFRDIGAVSNDWNNTMHQTPGRVNEGQVLPPIGYVIFPNGALFILRASVEGGHVRQTVGELVDSFDEARMTVTKGGEGTNIVYTVDQWWEIASVTTNGAPVAELVGKDGTFVFTAGVGCSNDLRVVATARPREDLRVKYGLDENNPYTPAVMDWLGKGVNYFGEPFTNPGEIRPVPFKGLFSDDVLVNLTLTETYWLDIDPTDGGWVLRGGVLQGPSPKYNPPPRNPRLLGLPVQPEYEFQDKMRMKVKLMITNEASEKVYAPYILRGLEPGSASDENFVGAWTSVTFKVTADLQNDLPGRTRWAPLRWFTFAPDATKAHRSASFADDFTSEIDFENPREPGAVGTTTGWEAFPNAPIFYRWDIDTRIMPVTVEVLRPDSTYLEE